MPPKLLADENVPWPLVRLLRSMGLDVVWIPETSYRGISDNEVINLANRDKKVVLTRDSDYLKPSLRRKARVTGSKGRRYIKKVSDGNVNWKRSSRTVIVKDASIDNLETSSAGKRLIAICCLEAL